MEVVILENQTGQVIGTYSIVLGNVNSKPSKDDYFLEAWTSAIEDGLVDADRKSDYSFKFGY